MYIDFKLTETGDVFFEKKEYSKPLKLSFNLSNTKAMKLSFDFESESIFSTTKNDKTKISFHIKQEDNHNLIATLTKEEELSQRLFIDLNTLFEELPFRKDIGTKLCLYRHEISNKSTLDKIKNIVTQKSEQYFSNPTVIVKSRCDKNMYYCQYVNIDIYQNETLVLNYKIKE